MNINYYTIDIPNKKALDAFEKLLGFKLSDPNRVNVTYDFYKSNKEEINNILYEK